MAKIDVIKAVAHNLGDFIVDSTPASLTGSTLDILTLLQPNANQLQGKYAYIYSGAGAGQSRVIGSYAPTNHRIIFPQVFASIPSVNSSVLITSKFDKSEYNNAIERYIGIAKTKFLEDKVGTLQIVASQYEYAVPSGMKWISTLRLVPSNNATDYGGDDEVDQIFELPPRVWRIECNVGGTYVIVFDSRKIDLDNYDTEFCRVVGQSPPDIAATDNASIPQDIEEFLIAGASMQLASLKVSESEKFKTMYYMYRDALRDNLSDYIQRYGRGKQVGT